MKKLTLFFISLLVCIISFAKKKQSIFSAITEAQHTLSPKPTIVYSYLSWCGGNKGDIEHIYPIINKYRNCINLIVLSDDTAPKNKYIVAINPDTIINYHPYYPSFFRKKNEAKQFAKDFNQNYNTKDAFLLGPGTTFLLDTNSHLIKRFIYSDKEMDCILTSICK